VLRVSADVSRTLNKKNGNTLKCHIISAGLSLDYLQTTLVYIKRIWNYKPSRVCRTHFSRSCNLWENRDLTGQPVIAYICFCMRSYAFFLSFFSNRRLNGPETELKCKIVFRIYIIFSLYHTQTVGA
jgi:hypothetical protein